MNPFKENFLQADTPFISSVAEEPRNVTYLYFTLKVLAGLASGILLAREVLLLFEII